MNDYVRVLPLALCSFGLLSDGLALASEEHIVPWHSVTVVAQVGEPHGDVQVTIETQQVADFDVSIKTLRIISQGKELVVPKEAIATIKNPALGTLRISHEAGYDKHPWLYVSIVTGAPQRGMAQWDYPRVYLAFQDGKFVKRLFAFRQKDGGTTFRDPVVTETDAIKAALNSIRDSSIDSSSHELTVPEAVQPLSLNGQKAWRVSWRPKLSPGATAIKGGQLVVIVYESGRTEMGASQ